MLLMCVCHFTVGVHWQQYPPVLNIFSSCYISNIAGMGSIYTPRVKFKLSKSWQHNLKVAFTVIALPLLSNLFTSNPKHQCTGETARTRHFSKIG